jgi:dihydrolipoamide dehydrogenase
MTTSYDLAVIGAGPGGYVAALRAAKLGLKVVCIEKRKELGGTCLNVGCIPSKALLHASYEFYSMKHLSSLSGIKVENVELDFPAMMHNKEGIINPLREGIAGLFKKNKVDHIQGAARFVSATELAVDEDKKITAKAFIIATGSEPVPLPFAPFDEKKILSSTGALTLGALPKKLVVIGAGVIGVELGSVYQRLGTKVVLVEFLDKICPFLDGTIATLFHKILEKQGLEFRLGTKVLGIEACEGVKVEIEDKAEGRSLLDADAALVSIGRRPYTTGLGLQEIGIELTSKGQVVVDSNFRTAKPHIYAIGDVIDGPMLAHKASEEGACVAEIIAGKGATLDYVSIPNVVYTQPEVASVGFTEEELKSKGRACKVGTYSFKGNSRAKCYHLDEGLVKVIADAATEKVLGVHIAGPGASEMIAIASLALQKRMSVKDLAHTCFAHPTLSEALKEACLDTFGAAIHK